MGLFSRNNDYKLLLEKYNGLENKYLLVKKECEELREALHKIKNEEGSVDQYSLDFVDELTDAKFIDYMRYVLSRLAYDNVDVLNTNDDLKVDILAEKDNIKYVIKCKKTLDLVNSDAVKEAYEGKKYCGRNVAVVITNGRFSDGAVELSRDTGVVLWDKEVLSEMLNKLKGLSKEQIDAGEVDPLYDEVLKFVVDNQKVSASLLQRKFKLGYNRASRLVDALEENGIVGPANGSNPREVLVERR